MAKMNTITIRIDNLRTTRYTTLSGLNIALARSGQSDGLFTDDEAAQLIEYLKTQPIDEAQISNINCYGVADGSETYSPYQMSFGTGGFKAELREWCDDYPLSFDVEVFFFEYDDDYQCHRSHLVNTYKRWRKQRIVQIKNSLELSGHTEQEINNYMMSLEGVL